MVAANLAIWFAFPLSNALRMPVQLGLAGALILWLMLLRVVLNRTSTTAPDVSSARSLAVGAVDHNVLASPNTSLERTRER